MAMPQQVLNGQRYVPEQRAPAAPAIPTDDPAAALAFCRQLAALLGDAPAIARLAALDPADMAAERPELSVVIPVFNEEGNLPELYARLSAVLAGTSSRYEIIFVDDGSRDASPSLLRAFAGADPRVRAVELSRNFGHQIAISAGRRRR